MPLARKRWGPFLSMGPGVFSYASSELRWKGETKVRWDVVREGESLSMLSARLARPGCMLMRANRIYSPAWLLPGREIVVPDEDFCLWDSFRCPVQAVKCPATERRRRAEKVVGLGDSVTSLARETGLTERMVYRAAKRSRGTLPLGLRLRLPVPPQGCVCVNALPGMRLEDLARRYGVQAFEIRQLNDVWGPVLPGMRLLIPVRG